VILPHLRPDLYTGLRTPPRGILLYGPPGTGKTMLARAAAHESNLTFFACSASSLTSKWVGEGEKLVKALFTVAKRMGPSIVFLDELDSVLSARGGGNGQSPSNSGSGPNREHEASRRLKTEFMIQVDGVRSNTNEDSSNKQHVLVLGCTNCPWDLDEAVLRRFERRIYVPLPDKTTRFVLLQNLLEGNRHSLSLGEIEELVSRTEGYSCSDLTFLCSEAAFGPLRSLGGVNEIASLESKDLLRPILVDDFWNSLKNSKRSVSNRMLQRYEEWEMEC